MKQHRIMMIGHGKISKAYIRAISAISHAEVVGVVGRSEEKVKAFAAEHGIAAYGTDPQQVARQSRASAAVICTPNGAHHEGVMQASRLGLDCLCEKPLHIAPDWQERMIDSCNRHGVKLAVSYMRRFHNHVQFVKRLIDSGKLGRVLVADVTLKHYRPREYYDSWHGTYGTDGGGPFIQQGSHIIDLALWICGGYREVLAAKTFQMYHDIETEDHGYAIVKYGNGAVGMIEASTSCVKQSKEVIELSGTEGSIALDFSRIVSFDVPGCEPPVFEEEEDVFHKLVADFLHAIESGEAPYVDGASAKVATELIIDIYNKAGKPVRMF